MTRYQDCSWLVRRWRDRWLLMVPYWSLKSFLRGERIVYAWDVSLGWCDVKRNWLYSWEEMEQITFGHMDEHR